jgi:hypothetical protein
MALFIRTGRWQRRLGDFCANWALFYGGNVGECGKAAFE